MSKTIGVTLSLRDQCTPQLKKIAQAFNICEKQAEYMNRAFKKSVKVLNKDFGNACKAVSIGVGALTAATAKLVINSTEAGDRIDKMSQKMQMSRQTFQELDYVFSQNGASIDMMQSGMSRLSKTMDGARTGSKANVKTFKDLGISLKDTNGQIKSTETVMFEAMSSLQKMPEGSQKSALALQLFGKSATELMPLLNGNAKSVDELRKKFNDLGMGMSDQQIDSAVKFKDTMDTLQRTLTGFGNSIGADILPHVQQLADALINRLPQIKSNLLPVLNVLSNVVKFTIDNFSSLSKAVVVCTGYFIAFKSACIAMAVIKSIATVVDILTIAVKLNSAAFKTHPIIMGITWGAAAITFVVNLIKHWRTLTNILKKGSEFISLFNPITKGTANSGATATGGNVPKHAGGTSYASGGLALVGERGPELVNLPTGAKVSTAEETKKAMGSNITVNVNIAGNMIGNQEFINQISNALGRQLQVALQC